jgi:hypothetical protein
MGGILTLTKSRTTPLLYFHSSAMQTTTATACSMLALVQQGSLKLESSASLCACRWVESSHESHPLAIRLQTVSQVRAKLFSNAVKQLARTALVWHSCDSVQIAMAIPFGEIYRQEAVLLDFCRSNWQFERGQLFRPIPPAAVMMRR